MTTAIVRPPGESFVRALSGHVPRTVPDPVRARKQHAAYCQALRAAGAEVLVLEVDEEHPDACFVQDTAVVHGDLAVIGRFSVPSRQGEQEAIRQALAGRRRVAEIQPPGALEGGDVLVVGSRLFVGLSTRTNRPGFAQLRDLLELQGATVEAIGVARGLHLLSECTYLGRGVLLATKAYAGHPAFGGLDVVVVPRHEAPAANALAVVDSVLLPAGYPETTAQVRARGFQVVPLDLSEFAKADGGATCLSLLL